ncbi:MAG TPA: hypothetical protein VFO39_04585, partial [Candidatus Sulfotelmatobacter sp.]|nr:hypothetical protein [Candidatus Sulfotelmatobacter sp.]
TLSPASTRRTAANFNSGAYPTCFSRDMRSPCRELSPLSLPQFWGALHGIFPNSKYLWATLVERLILDPGPDAKYAKSRQNLP